MPTHLAKSRNQSTHLSIRLAPRVVDGRIQIAHDSTPRIDVSEYNFISALTAAITRLVIEAERRGRQLKNNKGVLHTGITLFRSLADSASKNRKVGPQKDRPTNLMRKLGWRAFEQCYLHLLETTCGKWSTRQEEDAARHCSP